MLLDILIEDPRWSDFGFAPIAERAVGAALHHLELPPEACEISIVACDDARIAALNADFRGKLQSTNVLSWPEAERGAQQDGAMPMRPAADHFGHYPLGDIAIAYETCAAEAVAANTPMADHVSHLIVHGTLHLLGYDHNRDKDATLMEGFETQILGNMGLSDPYRV